MKLINLTPHAISMMNADGSVNRVLASSGVARCLATSTKVGTVDVFDINESHFGEVTGLPAAQSDAYFIVSRIVAEACKGQRDDLLIVDKTVRNAEGQIIGATAFARV